MTTVDSNYNEKWDKSSVSRHSTITLCWLKLTPHQICSQATPLVVLLELASQVGTLVVRLLPKELVRNKHPAGKDGVLNRYRLS